MNRQTIAAAFLACTALMHHGAAAFMQNLRIPSDAVVKTDMGQVQGELQDGVFVYHSIPFAAPPTGDLRFRPPEPVQPWEGVKDVRGFKPICPQLRIIGDLALSLDEDCLYLNVYVPETDGSRPLPVMFWIFGGGYVLGDGDEFGFYDGKNLAKEHEVIVVAPNYRLDAFGFLALPELQNEDPNNSTGNMALRDQQAALRWTQKNIAAFGGDPDRVTIFGESAGGFSICWHLASPGSTGLFSAAIMESGSCDSPQFFFPPKVSFDFGYQFAEAMGCKMTGVELLACLRAKSVADLIPSVISWLGEEGETALDVQQRMQPLKDALGMAGLDWETAGKILPPLGPIMPWGPTIDGTQTALPDLPLTLIEKGQFNKVPAIFGTNKDEGTIFVPALPLIVKGTHFPPTPDDLTQAFTRMLDMRNTTLVASLMPGVFAQYPLSDFNNDAWARAAAILTDYFFACGTRRSARAVASHNVPIWLYHFVYKLDFIEGALLGDYHASELVFVFDNQWPIILHDFSDKDKNMAASFGHYWTNMAIHGTPNDVTSPLNWPAYNQTTDININMDVPLSVNHGLKGKRCDFWDNYEKLVR